MLFLVNNKQQSMKTEFAGVFDGPSLKTAHDIDTHFRNFYGRSDIIESDLDDDAPRVGLPRVGDITDRYQNMGRLTGWQENEVDNIQAKTTFEENYIPKCLREDRASIEGDLSNPSY